MKVLWLILFLMLQACQQQNKVSNTVLGPQTQGTTANVQLTWNSSYGEQQGFNVEISNDGVNFSLAQTVSNGIYTASFPGLTRGQTYYFRVKSFNTAGFSPYSQTIMVSP